MTSADYWAACSSARAARDVLTPGLIAEVFGVRARVVWDAEVDRL
jgi:hypothetical protein